MSAFSPKRDLRSREHSSGKHAAWVRDQHAPSSASLTHLRLIDFSVSCYTGRWLLDHLNLEGIDCRSYRLFYFPRSFLHWGAFGLGLDSRFRFCRLACLTAFSRVCSSHFGSALYF